MTTPLLLLKATKIGTAVASLMSCSGQPDGERISPALMARLVARYRSGQTVPPAIDRAFDALDRRGVLKLRLSSPASRSRY